jgi:hypothetical protein
VAAGRKLFGEERDDKPTGEPIRPQTEAEIREAEQRYDREAKALKCEAEAERGRKRRGSARLSARHR